MGAMPPQHPIVQFVKDQPSDILARLKTQAGRKSPPHIFVAGVRKALTSVPIDVTKQFAIRNAIAGAQASSVDVELHVINPENPVPNKDWSRSRKLFITAQFNPAELERGIKVNYAELKPVGLPHAHMHYVGTDNQTMKFSLFMDAMIFEDSTASKRGFQKGGQQLAIQRGMVDLAERMAFLEAVCYPPDAATSAAAGGPPRLLFSWPNFISWTCILTDLNLKVTRWAPTGEALHVQADLTLREIRQKRLSMEIVRKVGAERGGESGTEVPQTGSFGPVGAA